MPLDITTFVFYLAVQEDEFLEWATFWGFVVAAGIYFASAWHQFKLSRRLPWFVYGLAIFLVYSWYPWSHTGEWVELTMAFGFAYAALFECASASSVTRKTLTVFAIIWVLAALTVAVVRYAHAADPERLAMTRQEVDALRTDFASGRVHTRCGIHKRLYTFVNEYQQAYLLRGEFSRLLESGGNSVRAEYLLDPWNSAYWIRHKCRHLPTVDRAAKSSSVTRSIRKKYYFLRSAEQNRPTRSASHEQLI